MLHFGKLRPIAFAGIWTGEETDEGWIHSIAILTRDAHPAIAEIHNRMPAVAHSRHYDAWLSPDTSSEDAQQIAVEPVDSVTAYPVSTYVNRPQYKDERCIDPIYEP